MIIRISRLSALLFFELLVLIPYDFFDSIRVIHNSLAAIKIIIIVCEAFALVKSKLKNSRSENNLDLYTGSSVALIIYALLLFFITAVLNNSLYSTANICISYIILALAIPRSLYSSPKETLSTLKFYFWLGILLNLITLLIFKDGLYSIYKVNFTKQGFLLGEENQFGKFIIPGFAFIWFSEYKENKRFFTITSLIAISCIYILNRNGTGIIVSAILIASYIWFGSKIIDRIISIRVFIIVIAVAVISLILQSGIMYSDSVFSQFIFNITGKNATFSGRTDIWSRVIPQIFKRPFFGYGRSLGDGVVLINSYIFSTHNIFLQAIVDTGFIGLAFFILPILIAAKRAEKVVNAHRELRILYIGLFTSTLYFMMEVGTLVPYFTLIILLATYSSSVEQGKI